METIFGEFGHMGYKFSGGKEEQRQSPHENRRILQETDGLRTDP